MNRENRPEPGDRFVPWRKFLGFMIPDPVAASNLSLGAKLCYGVLCRFAGKNGKCHPTIETIRNRICMGRSQTISYLNELADEGYIERRRGGSGRSTRYYFLWRAEFSEVRDSAPEKSGIPNTEENQLREYDLDLQATHRKRRDEQPAFGGINLSDLISQHLGRLPSRVCISRILAETPHGFEGEAIEAIVFAIRRGYGAGSKHEPKSQKWFEIVVRNHWKEAERYGLPPPAESPAMGASQFDQWTAAIDTLSPESQEAA